MCVSGVHGVRGEDGVGSSSRRRPRRGLTSLLGLCFACDRFSVQLRLSLNSLCRAGWPPAYGRAPAQPSRDLHRPRSRPPSLFLFPSEPWVPAGRSVWERHVRLMGAIAGTGRTQSWAPRACWALSPGPLQAVWPRGAARPTGHEGTPNYAAFLRQSGPCRPRRPGRHFGGCAAAWCTRYRCGRTPRDSQAPGAAPSVTALVSGHQGQLTTQRALGTSSPNGPQSPSLADFLCGLPGHYE